MKNFTLGMIFGVLAMVGCSRETGEVPHRGTPVTVRPVGIETGYAAERVMVGEVRARRSGEVGFEVAGTIDRLEVEVGDVVAAGEVVAGLDTRRLEARLAEARAAENEARAQAKFARSTLERTRMARQFEAVSQQAEDDAIKELAEAEARLARAEAMVAVIEVDLEKSVLRAPYAATIDGRLVDLGASVVPSQAVLRLVGRERPEIRFTVAAEVAADLELGQKMRFSSLHGEGQGRLVRVRGQRDALTRSVEAFLEMEGEMWERLRPGTVVAVRIERKVAQPGFWLERQALTEGTRGLWACFVAVPEEGNGSAEGVSHRLARVDLEWLHEAGERVFVRGLLQEGDLVVREGLHRVTPGMGVSLVVTKEEAR